MRLVGAFLLSPLIGAAFANYVFLPGLGAALAAYMYLSALVVGFPLYAVIRYKGWRSWAHYALFGTLTALPLLTATLHALGLLSTAGLREGWSSTLYFSWIAICTGTLTGLVFRLIAIYGIPESSSPRQ